MRLLLILLLLLHRREISNIRFYLVVDRGLRTEASVFRAYSKKKIMRSLLLFIIMLSLSLSMKAQTAAQDNPNAPEITFETEVLDYGTIEYASNGVREFKFKNTGKSDLILQNVQSSCGCLSPTWPKEPIKPGESKVIKALYDTRRVGPFEKTITVRSNAKTPIKVIKVKGKVLPNPNPDPAPVPLKTDPVDKSPYEKKD
jgi:hypothetical protein